MTRLRQMWVLLMMLGVLTAGVGGCASSQSMEPASTMTPMDLPSLAGTWQGTASGAQGLSQPITMKIAADGAYTVDGGVYTALGTAAVKDGKLVLTSTTTSGGQAAPRVSTAVLSEKKLTTQVIQVLAGSGASTAGPFTFEVSRPKQ